jgi:lantibiotic modifying enzyme
MNVRPRAGLAAPPAPRRRAPPAGGCLLLLAVVACSPAPAPPPPDPLLAAALDAGRWVRAAAVPTMDGVTWPADPDDPATAGASLYSGAAGVVPVLLALHRANGDHAWLASARAGADELLSEVDRVDDAGLYTGLAGIGFALLEASRELGDERYQQGVRRTVDRLAALARPAGNGVEWSETTDVIAGGAGVGLFLLDADRRLGLPAARQLALDAGERLLELAEPRPDGAVRWQMAPGFEREMPNFSHGTAGIAYFLATLHRTSGDPRFLDAALAGARYLLQVAETEGDLCLIFHHAPGGEDLHYLSWCHGPAGTARLFHRLWQITSDPAWREWVDRSARAILASGVPEQRTPGFWNNVGQCCGSAGLIDFFVSAAAATGEPSYLDFARRVADDLLARAEPTPEGLRWVQAEHRVRPELLVAQTGYMQGAAGIAHALLRLHLASAGEDTELRLPDDPWRD